MDQAVTYKFFRKNAFVRKDEPATPLTEKETRSLIAASVNIRWVDKKIEQLKRGGIIKTQYGSYWAERIKS